MMPPPTGPAGPTTGTFLDNFPGFLHWASTADMWPNQAGVTWIIDINCRTVRIATNGVVSICPDEAGSTAWFADILGGAGGPALVAVPA